MRTALVMAVLLAAAALSCGRTGVGGGGLKGRAVSAGKAASGAEVNIYDVPEKSSVPPVMSVQADKEGRFTASLKPGTYYVAVRLNSATGGPPALSKVPPDPVVVERGVVDVGEMALDLGGGVVRPAPGTGVKGRVVRDGLPVVGASVYLYGDTDSGLKGPTYQASGRSDADGSFSVDAAPGAYYVTARKRMDEKPAGELSPGDLSGVCKLNPVAVKAGGYMDAGVISLAVIDPVRLNGLKIGIKEERGAASVSGSVTDEGGKPLSGAYVFAYDDYRMMGKPHLISEKTGPDGQYRIVLDRPGKYYLGARTSLGGPMEPGDLVGVYGGSPDNSVVVAKGARMDKADITLKEVQ